MMVREQAEWYVLQCKSQQGFRAQEHLQNQGYHCFHPLVNVECIQRQQRLLKQEPLFPGYLFIYLDNINDNWGPIRSTRGVSRMVSFNGQPLPVANELIEQLRERTTDIAPLPSFQTGDRVRINDGAFAELGAIFHAFEGEQRAIIFLNLLHRTQRIRIPVGQISRA